MLFSLVSYFAGSPMTFRREMTASSIYDPLRLWNLQMVDDQVLYDCL